MDLSNLGWFFLGIKFQINIKLFVFGNNLIDGNLFVMKVECWTFFQDFCNFNCYILTSKYYGLFD